MSKKSLNLFLVTITILTAQQAFAKDKKKPAKEVTPSYLADSLIQPVPMNRLMFYEKPLKEVTKADKRDGAIDKQITISGNTAASTILTKSIINEIPKISLEIENMNLTHNDKIRLHQALYSLTLKVNNFPNWSSQPTYIQNLVNNFQGLLTARADSSLDTYVNNNLNEFTIENRDLLYDKQDLVNKAYKTYGMAHPLIMIKQLPTFADRPIADDIVAAAAKENPEQVLNYAMSTGYLSNVVSRNQDPLVRAIVKLAKESKKPLNALPFLGDIYNKKRTVAQIDAIVNNPVEYYKNLVRLKEEREPIAAATITSELNYRSLYFIRTVNDLHEATNDVRFKVVQPFNAPELYFLLIGAQDEIYTSSFTNMFKLFMERLPPMSGDVLLDTVDYTHFRTFIRMTANYNTLQPFLATMSEAKKNELLQKFVSGLEEGGDDDLEDAVDVATVFASVTDDNLLNYLKKEVTNNYERCGKLTDEKKAKKGIIVYGLLSTIFNNTASTDANNIGNGLNLPPITYVPIDNLKSANGEVYEQVFFYGDEDGINSFGSFMNNFKGADWKVDNANKEWVKISSVGKPVPVTIFANRPLKAPEDETAQDALAKYLESNNIVPSLIIHRGHSFHLSGTIDHLTDKAKVVILGSCGGFHNLAMVLDKSPDAAIISSKQTGSMSVNDPIIRSVENSITEGKDINWLQTWGGLTEYFSKKSKEEQNLFSDYIPPNKNLGAIFIKAYRQIQMNEASKE